jgi:hypothetical protein
VIGKYPAIITLIIGVTVYDGRFSLSSTPICCLSHRSKYVLS